MKIQNPERFLGRCRALARRLGIQDDEAASIVGMAYSQAAVAYDPSRGPFEALLWTTAKNAILTAKQAEDRYRRAARTVRESAAWENLSEDADAVVRLVLGCERRPTAKQLAKRLADNFGWTTSRIAESFAEIRRVLQ